MLKHKIFCQNTFLCLKQKIVSLPGHNIKWNWKSLSIDWSRHKSKETSELSCLFKISDFNFWAIVLGGEWVWSLIRPLVLSWA